tara:strand:+ start:9454 stop:10296 length:843 start_codon:yes stop_codon:yes gene_type:complete
MSQTLLGCGSYGRVQLVEQRAVKTVPVDSYASFYAALREEYVCRLLRLHRHPNLVHVFGTSWTNSVWQGTFEVGTCLESMSKSEIDAAGGWSCALRHLTSGLAFLHARGIAHRDIKPANVIFANGFKLIDFGLARPMQAGVPPKGVPEEEEALYGTSYVTSRWWRPIELLENEHTNITCDVWSLGVMCLSLQSDDQVVCGNAREVHTGALRLMRTLGAAREMPWCKMITRLNERWNIFQLCEYLHVSYDLDVTPPTPGQHHALILGYHCDKWEDIAKCGI